MRLGRARGADSARIPRKDRRGASPFLVGLATLFVSRSRTASG
jgi:hypothetical protein